MTIVATDVRNTIGKHMLADGMDQVIDLEKSHGSWLVDARDEQEYLDLFDSHRGFRSSCFPTGHPVFIPGHFEIVDFQSARLQFLSTAHFGQFFPSPL